MPKTFFDFSGLIIGCLHQDGFTNTVKKEEIKTILTELLQMVQIFSANDFHQTAQKIEHCHEVKSEYLKDRIGQLTNLKKRDIKDLERQIVWQIPLGAEARLFGLLQKIRCRGVTHLFQTLILDPNHKVYRPSNKENFPIIANSVCLFAKEDECWEVIRQKKLTKKIHQS